MNKKIRKTAFCSIISALSCALVLLGTYFEILDLTVCALCSFAVLVAYIEAGKKFALLTYFTSACLCLILSPISTSVLYYVFVFGYFPVLHKVLEKTNKVVSTIIKCVVFNSIIASLLFLFSKIFGFDEGSSKSLYIALFVMNNIFFLCYDYSIKVFEIIYTRKLKSKLNLKL